MPTEDQQQHNSDSEDEDERDALSDSSLDSESEPDSDSDTEPNTKKTKPAPEKIPEDDNSPEANLKRFSRILDSKRYNKQLDLDDELYTVSEHELFNFPIDPEDWKEEDLRELWADGPASITKPGWDPALVDDNDWETIVEEIEDGNEDPPIAPFYLPYRKYYPAIPDNHHDISNPKAVVEELDRIEEFLGWVSYVFPDGSSYEGTVWDDLAHGKGVYIAEQGLVRFEGEWLQNNMEGHGVVEVDVPDIEPLPGSKLEEEMRAEGRVFKRDFMNPEDKEWLEMDMEDSVRLADGTYELPWHENDEWIRQFGEKPEKGRYRYAGQWKHSRMHGCGVYEVNERTIFGRFYFGEMLDDPAGCDEEVCAAHAGIADVAAAKARMFINKPDGMVREQRGPYGDPQHPYFYEEEDAWQAPGFINQFYEVPDYWKTYVNEVDQEREMWLNSFYKAPLRLPMPAELEHWWENDKSPEFVLLNKEPEPDPDDPSKLIYTEDPVILHTPTGRVINYVEDEEHGIRLFWQPPLKEGEDVDPEKVEFLPLGFDEFYGRETENTQTFVERILSSVESKTKPYLDKLAKWAEERKLDGEMKRKLVEQELELLEAELSLEEAIEDMEEELKQEEKEAQKKVEMGLPEDVSDSLLPAEEQEEKVLPQEGENEEEEEEEEEEEDELAPSSFGSVDDGSTKNKGNGPSKSSFSTLSFASSGFLSTIPSMVDQSFSVWKKGKSPMTLKVHPTPSTHNASDQLKSGNFVTFPKAFPENLNLKVKAQANYRKTSAKQPCKKFGIRSRNSYLTCQSITSNIDQKGVGSQSFNWHNSAPDTNSDCILLLQVPLPLPCSDVCIK